VLAAGSRMMRNRVDRKLGRKRREKKTKSLRWGGGFGSEAFFRACQINELPREAQARDSERRFVETHGKPRDGLEGGVRRREKKRAVELG